MEERNLEKVTWNKIYQRNRKTVLIERLLNIYSAVGLLVFIFSIIGFFFNDIFNRLNPEQRIYLLGAAAGLSTVLFSRFFLALRKVQSQTGDNSEVSLIQFLRSWNRFEQSVSESVVHLNPDLKSSPIRKQISMLRDRNILDDVDILVANVALKSRNHLVHDLKFDNLESIQVIIGQLDSLSEKLQSKR